MGNVLLPSGRWERGDDSGELSLSVQEMGGDNALVSWIKDSWCRTLVHDSPHILLFLFKRKLLCFITK